MVGGQVMIIFVGDDALQVRPLTAGEWGISIILGALSLPVGMIVRLFPDEIVRRLLPASRHRKKTPQVVVSDEDHRFEWNQAIVGIREELAFFKKLRGGRLKALKFRLQHPKEILHHPLGRTRSDSRSRSSSIPQTPNGGSTYVGDYESAVVATPQTPESKGRRRARSRSNSAFGPAAAMAGVVAGSIAGWSPIDRAHGDRDSFGDGKETELNDGTTPVIRVPEPAADRNAGINRLPKE